MIAEFKSRGNYPDGSIFYRADSGDSWNIWCPVCASDEYAKADVEPKTFTASARAIRDGLLACRCSRFYHWSEAGRTYQIKKAASSMGYEFAGYPGSFSGRGSKVILRCQDHGEWTCSINGIVNKGNGCRSCASNGFRPERDGFVYCLVSECRLFVKVGITHSPQTRIRCLKSRTPFEFSVHAMMPMKGKDAMQFEKKMHWLYDSAELTGFDGATEWLIYHPDIFRCFK